MAGSVAVAAHSIPEALAQLDAAEAQGVDLIKLMITGGVMDAKEKGVPGEMKMPPEMIKAVCDRAHAAGYRVAAHVESPQGVRAALENGVDSIEHGAKPDAEILRLFKDTGAFLCTTISPALPYALFDRSITHATEVEQYNGTIVFEGIIDCAKAALANDIPVVLGNDVGCPWITQYDFWRELFYFHKYTGVSNAFALYTATSRSAELAGIGSETGTVAPGKCADLIVTAANPLEDLRALRHVGMVMARGQLTGHPRFKRRPEVEAQLDRFLMKITMDYPSLDEEVNILERHHSNAALVKLDDITPALTKEELLTLRAFMKNVFVDRTLLQYIALIVQQTRTSKAVYLGASPRASVAMMQASKAYALLQGRDFVTPEDIKFVAPYVLQHRLILTAEAEMEGYSPVKVTQRLIDKVEVPK